MPVGSRFVSPLEMRPVVAATLASLGLWGCTFSSLRLERSTPDALNGDSPLADLVVAAYPVSSQSAEGAVNFAADLYRSGVFERVVLAPESSEADLVAEVSTSSGVARCGTPYGISRATLGIWHGSTAYFHRYGVEFRSGNHRQNWRFEAVYTGSVLSGLAALPKRASRAWSRWPSKNRDAPEVVIRALRDELLAESERLRSLVDLSGSG